MPVYNVKVEIIRSIQVSVDAASVDEARELAKAAADQNKDEGDVIGWRVIDAAAAPEEAKE